MKIYIETLGCPKNAVDSECAAGILEKAGHSITESCEEADGIMVNTCAFINDAKKESIDTILRMGEYAKAENKLLIVSGCMGERYKDELFTDIPEADLIIGVNDYETLPGLLDEIRQSKGRLKGGGQAAAVYTEASARKRTESTYKAYLRISEGCDNHCTYCVIPAIRGPFRSRRFENIIEEAVRLADQGCRELTIVAQDVTNYGIDLYGEHRLAELLDELCQINAIKWIRLMYCYSDKIDDKLIKVIANNEKICKYIDIPIQHASDAILTAMGRQGDKASILKTLAALREQVPDIHIRTTLIVGFPGESKEDFEELLAFTEEMKFDRLGVFAYSKEERTPAGRMKGQIRESTKQKRRDAVMELQRGISLAKNEQKIGQILEVLIEEEDSGEGIYTGRSMYDAFEIDNAVMVRSTKSLAPGDFVQVKITDAFDYDLVGEAL